MKKTLRMVSLFLVGMMLLALTACGGSSGGVSGNADKELTSKINSKLSGTGIHVTYDSGLGDKAVVCLDVYRTSGNEAQAMAAAGVNAREYAIYATTATSSLDNAASVIAGYIRSEKASSGRVAKTIGYASATLTATDEPICFALVKF